MTSKNSIDSWLFLVSANRYLDYRTVLAPDFLCKIKKTSIIARNAGGDLTSYKVNHVYDPKTGNLTLVFRVIEAIAEDLDIEGSGILKDSFGREIYLIEGLCFNEKLQDIQLSEDDFVVIHNKIKPSFQDFWSWSAGKSPIQSFPEKYEGMFTIIDIRALENQIESVSDEIQKIEQEVDKWPKPEKNSKKKIGFSLSQNSILMSILVIFLIGTLIILIIKIVL